METPVVRWRVTPLVTAVIVGAWSYAAVARPDTNWNNPAGGSWRVAGNWDNGEPVDGTFNAFIDLAGPYTVTLDQSRTINNFQITSVGSTLALTGATLAMNGTYLQQGSVVQGDAASAVTVSGATTLRNATLTNLPSLTAAGSLLIDGPGDTSVLNALVSHTGTAGTWQGTGNLVFGGGAGATGLSLGATSVFTITNNQNATWNNSGTRSSVTNAGTLRKNGGTGTTFFQGVQLTNTGTVRASTGTLRFDTVSNLAGGTLTGGTWRVDTNATLDLVGQTVTTNRATVILSGANSTFAAINGLNTNGVGGTLQLLNGRSFTAQGSLANAGTLNIGAGSTLRVNAGNAFTDTSGSVIGAGLTSILAVDGSTDLTGTTFTNVRYVSTGTTHLGGNQPLAFDNTCFDHNGTSCSWDGNSPITVGGGSQFNFGAGSTLTIGNSQSMTWNNVGSRPTLGIAGTLVKSAGGTTTVTGVALTNKGTVRVSEGTLSADTVQNVVAGVLTGGVWRVDDNATLNFSAQTVTTNRATVTLDGANASFPALSGLTTVDVGGTLGVQNGKQFTTAGSFTITGTVKVVADTGAALFKVASGSTLTNYNPVTQTLTGGTLEVSGAGRASGTVEVDGLDIATLAASISLDGNGASILDPTAAGNTDALRSLATIDNPGTLEMKGGRGFTTAGNLVVASTGNLKVGADSLFTVNGDLANFDGSGGFNNGVFTIGGTLRANNALVTTLSNNVTLDGNARIERPDGSGGFIDAFATLTTITSSGNLTIRNGHNLTLLPGNLSSAAGSSLTIGPVAAAPGDTSLRVRGGFTQGGTALLDGGRLQIDGDYTQNGPVVMRNQAQLQVGGRFDNNSSFDLGGSTVQVGTEFNNNGMLNGSGTIVTGLGTLIVNNGEISPGHSPGRIEITGPGMVEMSHTAVVRMEIAGLVAGDSFDQLNIAGMLAFEGGSAGTLVVTVDPTFTPAPGQRFDLIGYGGVSGWFERVTVPGIFMEVRDAHGYALVVVPGPGAGWVLGGGVICMVGSRRRRR